MKASEAGYTECVKMLLNEGARVNMQDKGVSGNIMLMEGWGLLLNCVWCLSLYTHMTVHSRRTMGNLLLYCI